ncbi:hypothetical protein FXN63_09390 [Pigmentiphaga aceris]|uniref:Type III secretion system translocon subunit SctE n=1 Tax=Pigmentiphaga aceris TaxID=1940612 RepID=A0A5C0AWB0_9BURK|nr:hypothetical protein [Pigmentiphaga aceris]QEI06026.1 hypothetical protein FXN63_09390 [Pigmentiphaga aceris]
MSSIPVGGGASPISASFLHDAAPSGVAAESATVSTQAPISLTLPAPASESAVGGLVHDPASGDIRETASAARTALAGPVTVSSTPSRAADRTETLNDAAQSLQTSKDVGVDTSKRSFFTKLAGAVVSGVVVGLAAALTAVTAGAAAPLLAVACVNLAVSVGDAGCAYNNLQHAKEVARGDNPPKHSLMPMGNSCVDNFIHGTLTRCGVSADTAKTAATWVGRAVSLGIGIAGVLVSGGASQIGSALEIASTATKAVGAGIKLGVAGGGAIMDKVLGDEVVRQQKLEKEESRHAAFLRDPAGARMADQLEAAVSGTASKTPLPHETAADQAGLIKTGLAGAFSVAKMTGVVSMAATASMDLFHAMRG